MNNLFRKLAQKISIMAGNARTFIAAIVLIAVWLITGPIFDFSNTWQLMINTLTTITTFLMVFLIQNTQNRDSKAMHLKLDELIKVTKAARNKLIEIEEDTDEEMDLLENEFQKIKDKC